MSCGIPSIASRRWTKNQVEMIVLDTFIRKREKKICL